VNNCLVKNNAMKEL